MNAAGEDITTEPLELATVSGVLGEETHLASRVPCGPHPLPTVDWWWGTLVDIDCPTCRVAARCQNLRRQEGRA